jgi:hypothetical protein
MASLHQDQLLKPIPNVPILAGLVCDHANCGSLFSDMDDSSVHAVEFHAGVVKASTCAIQEVVSESGVKNLRLVQQDAVDVGKHDAANSVKSLIRSF